MSQTKTMTKHYLARVGERKLNVAATHELRSWGRVHWEVSGVLTELEARKVQTQFHGHPMGYGFNSFKYPNDTTTSWSCSVCCD